MDQAMMSTAMYEIQRWLAPMESRSTTVEDAWSDHAGRMDNARANIESMRAFAVKSETQRIAGKAERDQIRADLVTACERVNANDTALKADFEK